MIRHNILIEGVSPARTTTPHDYTSQVLSTSVTRLSRTSVSDYVSLNSEYKVLQAK